MLRWGEKNVIKNSLTLEHADYGAELKGYGQKSNKQKLDTTITQKEHIFRYHILIHGGF